MDRRPGDEEIPLLQRVLQAELHRVPAQAPCDDVHLGVVGPDHLRHPEAPKRPGRRLVGVDAVGVDGHVGDLVRPGGGIPRLVDDPRADLGEGAGVPIDLALARGHGRALDRGLDLHHDAVLGDRVELLLAAQAVLHRPAGLHGKQRHQRLELVVELGAVAAAQIRHTHADAVHGDAQHARQLPPHEGRRLAGGMDVDASAFVHVRQRHMGLHGYMLGRRRREHILEDAVRLGKGLFHVALAKLVVVADVGALAGLDVGQVRERPGRAKLLVDDGGVRLDGVEHVQHHRQRLVLHLHPFQRLFRGAPALRGHRHHLFALVAHPVNGQHRLVRERRPMVRRDTRHGGDVRARKHRGHTGAGLGPGLVDTDDARVGMGTSQHGHMQQPRRLQVARVQCPARHLLDSVPAINRRTNDGIIRHAFTSRRR